MLELHTANLMELTFNMALQFQLKLNNVVVVVGFFFLSILENEFSILQPKTEEGVKCKENDKRELVSNSVALVLSLLLSLLLAMEQ